jgi:WD40 repeat protein
MQFSPDQQRLFVTASDSSTHVFDLSTKTQVDALNGAELIGFSSDGRRLIAHDGDGIRLYDAHTLSPVSRMPGQITAFIGPKTGNLYATVAADGSVRLMEFERGDVQSWPEFALTSRKTLGNVPLLTVDLGKEYFPRGPKKCALQGKHARAPSRARKSQHLFPTRFRRVILDWM